jgi:hypothetical protein
MVEVSTSEVESDSSLRGLIVLVIIGVAASVLGGMMYAAANREPQGSDMEHLILDLGSLLLGCGVLMFLSGLLIEFFSIGSSLRHLAAHGAEQTNLLRQLARPESGIQNSESLTAPDDALTPAPRTHW